MSDPNLFPGVRVIDARHGPAADQPGGVIDDAVALGFEIFIGVGLRPDGGLTVLLNGMPPERAHFLFELAQQAIVEEMMAPMAPGSARP